MWPTSGHLEQDFLTIQPKPCDKEGQHDFEKFLDSLVCCLWWYLSLSLKECLTIVFHCCFAVTDSDLGPISSARYFAGQYVVCYCPEPFTIVLSLDYRAVTVVEWLPLTNSHCRWFWNQSNIRKTNQISPWGCGQMVYPIWSSLLTYQIGSAEN